MKNRMVGIIVCLLTLPFAFRYILVGIQSYLGFKDPFGSILLFPGLLLLLVSTPNLIAIFIKYKGKSKEYRKRLLFVQILSLLLFCSLLMVFQ
ncbi:hypothetical protein O3Q51_18250 [Cryomorphaceae bacterium 1068]|nr:hypothetical protein [Cryomorphaceae bacterium 1068]